MKGKGIVLLLWCQFTPVLLAAQQAGSGNQEAAPPGIEPVAPATESSGSPPAEDGLLARPRHSARLPAREIVKRIVSLEQLPFPPSLSSLRSHASAIRRSEPAMTKQRASSLHRKRPRFPQT